MLLDRQLLADVRCWPTPDELRSVALATPVDPAQCVGVAVGEHASENGLRSLAKQSQVAGDGVVVDPHQQLVGSLGQHDVQLEGSALAEVVSRDLAREGRRDLRQLPGLLGGSSQRRDRFENRRPCGGDQRGTAGQAEAQDFPGCRAIGIYRHVDLPEPS